MGSSADLRMTSEAMGIIPRVIQLLFDTILEKEVEDPRSSYKVHVQFLEIYGEDIRDLLDKTKTSKVTIRETASGEVFVSGAREEVVSSTAQMTKALEEGSRHRTTASTCMNNESSRSHAIFTVILEHTIQAVITEESFSSLSREVAEDGGGVPLARKGRASIGIAHAAAEVRRSKFHFVDLAGSERIKRTKAQGVQLREGIDINKGLLALGNVISALGDEQKRGKVHVPYRDSKLTRILQDSLGGNSKTLFICCVSPSSLNFYESVNALKYANRARNIKNKPVVNRDPTLVVIDELKELVQDLAEELLVYKHQQQESMSDPSDEKFSIQNLEELSTLNFSLGAGLERPPTLRAKGAMKERPLSPPTGYRQGSAPVVGVSKLSTQEVNDLRMKLTESEFELRRLSEQVKSLRLESSDLSDRLLLVESERDFYQMKFSLKNDVDGVAAEQVDNENAAPSEGDELLAKEKGQFIEVVMKYKQENEKLKIQLAALQGVQNRMAESSDGDATEGLESELTSSVARVIAQTKEQLLQEAKRLEKVAEECGLVSTAETILSQLGEDRDVDSDNDTESKARADAETDATAEEQAYQVRQKLLVNQLQELGESIVLKENLVAQLKKSQEQYSLMKSFYEQKLNALQLEVEAKEVERETLKEKLDDVVSNSNQTAMQADEEKRLKEELRRKDDELKSLKKKQNELSNLSNVQTRYLEQLKKMESDVDKMKKQKVDLTKLLQNEKKKHLTVLHEKVKEVERLKRELIRTTGEINKLSMEKARAEDRAREAIREGAALKKRKNESTMKLESANLKPSSKSAVVKMASLKSSSQRFLTADELKTKKWISTCVKKITDREAVIDSLRRLLDQQTALLSQKEMLESQRPLVESSEQVGKEELLLEIDEKLGTVAQQLKLKAQNISKLQADLDQGEEISDTYDKTVENMKRNISVQLLRLLFEMIVKSQQSKNLYQELMDKAQIREKAIKAELEDEKVKFASLLTRQENELVQVRNEYEEKLHGLFENTSVSKVLLAESASIVLPPDGATDAQLKDAHSSDSYKMVIAILTDQTNNLRERVSELEASNSRLKDLSIESETLLRKAQVDLQDKDITIQFLESERQLFRDMANDLRAGIVQFGGSAGQLIISQIRDKSTEKEKEKEVVVKGSTVVKSSRAPVEADMDTIPQPDDESENLVNEFNELAEEINRTGTLGVAKHAKGGVVYDRLTNPLNFTGSMKNVFEKDLAVRRQKVQKIKSQTLNNPYPKNSGKYLILNHTKCFTSCNIISPCDK